MVKIRGSEESYKIKKKINRLRNISEKQYSVNPDFQSHKLQEIYGKIPIVAGYKGAAIPPEEVMR